MDEVVGYLLVLSMIIFLIFELIRQDRELKNSKKDKKSKAKRVILIYSLFGFIVFFSLNILIALGIVANEFITSNNTALAAFFCFSIHIVVKYRPYFFQ